MDRLQSNATEPAGFAPERLSALHGYSLRDPAWQPVLHRATRLLATALGVEMAFIGVVNQQRVALIATHGIPSGDVGQQPGLCLTTVKHDAIRVIPDTLQDPLAAQHVLVTGATAVRFYAAIPLTTSDGFNLGTLCIADRTPNVIDSQRAEALHDVAGMLMRDIEAALVRDKEESAFQLSAMLESLPIAHFTCRLDGTVLSWSPAAEQTFHYEPNQIIGKHISMLTEDGRQHDIAGVLARVASRERVEWFSSTRLTGSGELIETQEMAYPIYTSSDNIAGAIWLARDVTEARRLEALVWESRERFETVVDRVRDGVVMTDLAGNVEYLNPAAEVLTGWNTAGARGQTAHDVIDLVHEESLERIEHPVQICLRDQIVVGPSGHAVMVHRDGRTFSINSIVAPVRHRDGTVIGTIMVFHERGTTGSASALPGYLGNHDPLTGLPSRHELENQIERALVTAARDNVEHALILLHVPQYAAVQYRQGQVAANELLKQVAVLLRTQIREVDTLARLEDERFAVFLTHCPVSQAQRIADQVQTVVNNYTFVWEGKATLIGLRTTLLPVDADIRNAATLLDVPEAAFDLLTLRREIQHRGLRSPDSPQSGSSRRLDAEQALNSAFATDRFRLYAQKIAALTPVDQHDQLFEFLVHMVDEDGRLLSPSVFVGAAARDHLAVELDRWVVHAALQSLRGQAVSPLAAWMINVSLPAMQDEAFPAYVRDQIDQSGIPARAICFEMSETIAIANLTTTMRFISDIRALGCRISISQFGTSLHTFAYLRNLQVDYLKIDGSVIRDIADDAIDRAVVGAIGHIAHVMGIQTVAEHVEDITVLECLKDLGIDYAQGYAVAKPLPLTIVS